VVIEPLQDLATIESSTVRLGEADYLEAVVHAGYE
jgi:hypothetical protein